MNTHSDDRGWSFMNIFAGKISGQINYSVVYPKAIKAWHRHKFQTDYWCVVKGNAKVGLYDEEKNEFKTFFIGEKNPLVLEIKPGIWHGMRAIGEKECGLLYFVTHEYDSKNPDEERAAFDAFNYSWDIKHK